MSECLPAMCSSLQLVALLSFASCCTLLLSGVPAVSAQDQAKVAGLCFEITTYLADGSVRSRDILQPLNAFTPTHPLVRDYADGAECQTVRNDLADWTSAKCTPVCGANFTAYAPLPSSLPFCSDWIPDFPDGSGGFTPSENSQCYVSNTPGNTCKEAYPAGLGEYFYAYGYGREASYNIGIPESNISNAAEILFICDEEGGCAFIMALDAIVDYDRDHTDDPSTEGVGSKGRTLLELDSPALIGKWRLGFMDDPTGVGGSTTPADFFGGYPDGIPTTGTLGTANHAATVFRTAPQEFSMDCVGVLDAQHELYKLYDEAIDRYYAACKNLLAGDNCSYYGTLGNLLDGGTCDSDGGICSVSVPEVPVCRGNCDCADFSSDKGQASFFWNWAKCCTDGVVIEVRCGFGDVVGRVWEGRRV